jgi:hypothetical protein
VASTSVPAVRGASDRGDVCIAEEADIEALADWWRLGKLRQVSSRPDNRHRLLYEIGHKWIYGPATNLEITCLHIPTALVPRGATISSNLASYESRQTAVPAWRGLRAIC